jgi:hypothetical protein
LIEELGAIVVSDDTVQVHRIELKSAICPVSAVLQMSNVLEAGATMAEDPQPADLATGTECHEDPRNHMGNIPRNYV